jgi:hypothetical protein
MTATIQARKMPVAIKRVRFATGLLRIMVNLFWAVNVPRSAPVHPIMTRTIFWATITLFSIGGYAQDVDAHLTTANEIFNGKVKFRIDRDDRLIADLFTDQGLVRQDVAYVEFLSPDSIFYSEAEQAVVMKCKAGEAQCIDKEIFKLNAIRHTGRSTFPIGPEKKQEAIAALAAVIRSAQEAQIAERTRATMPK